MFIISKGVAEIIRALGEREDVKRELAAIRAMPGFEVYANAIAEGTRGKERAAAAGKPAERGKAG